MKYAFFDLDGTLIPVDSSILWAETLLSHVGKDEKQLRAERIQYDVDYKNGCLDINKFEDFEMKLLARFPRRELDELRVQYLKRDIMPPAETLPSMRCISTRSAATFTIITTD